MRPSGPGVRRWAAVAVAVGSIGCGDRCETLCRDTSNALAACLGPSLTWPDVGARSRVDFVEQCRIQWDRTSADLTSSDLAEALDICELGQDELRVLTCDELRALYGLR